MESCVPGQVLPAPCAFAPLLRLEPCRRHSRAQSEPEGPHGLQGIPPGTGDTQGQCHRLGMLLGLIPNPSTAQQKLSHSTGAPGTPEHCSP